MEIKANLTFRNPLKNIDDYDCVGFDMDHTIARYHLKPFMEGLVEDLGTYLILNKGYPKEFLLTKEELSFSFPHCIFDRVTLSFFSLDSEC